MPKAKKKVSKKKAATSKVYKTARIGRFDGELKTVSFKAGDTVGQLAQRAGITIHTGEEVNDEKGNTVKADAAAKEQDYFLTGSYHNGIN